MTTERFPLLTRIEDPADLRRLSLPELKRLAAELRQFILETVARTGGHLASNLGSVELTLALHYVYDTPHDRLVWDATAWPHCANSEECPVSPSARKVLTTPSARGTLPPPSPRRWAWRSPPEPAARNANAWR
jgi:hypothetical protein